MISGYRATAFLGGLAGLSGVIMAAVGSHMAPGMDDPDTLRSWQAASMIHLVHAAVLLAIAPFVRNATGPVPGLSVFFIFAGTVLFSGSIYVSLLYGLAGTGGLAPAGGVMLMVGWLLIISNTLRS